LGAARLAWLADGGSKRDVCQAAPERQRFEPDAAQADELNQRYARFAQLYPRLHELWQNSPRAQP